MSNNKISSLFFAILAISGTIYLISLTRNSLKTYNYIGVSEEQQHSISINSEGKVISKPDIAKINLGYSVEKKTVADAQNDNTQKINKIITLLKKDFNIDEKDIKTSNYSINPQYNWDEGKQTLRAYKVRQNVNIKVRDLVQVGKILEIAGQTGLNQIGGLSFEIDDPEKLKQEARIIALKNAKQKAKDLSDLAGVKLGKIISFSESDYQPTPQPMYRAYAMEEAGRGGAAPAVEAGSNEIIVNVTVVYEIL